MCPTFNPYDFVVVQTGIKTLHGVVEVTPVCLEAGVGNSSWL